MKLSHVNDCNAYKLCLAFILHWDLTFMSGKEILLWESSLAPGYYIANYSMYL
jgi:hypothetical protein